VLPDVILQMRPLLAQMLFILFGDEIDPLLGAMHLLIHLVILGHQFGKMGIRPLQGADFASLIRELKGKRVRRV